MTTTYQPLFKVGVQHAYYKQLAAAGDFAIRPSQATAALMRRHRLRFNGYNTPADTGFDIYFAASSGRTPQRALPSYAQFNFLLSLKEASLLNVSDLDVPGPGRVHYYGLTELSSSDSISTILPPKTIEVKGSHFMHRFSKPAGFVGAAPTLTFELRDGRFGNTVKTYTVVPDTEGNYSIELKLFDLPEGLYFIAYNTFPVLNAHIYLSDEVKANPVFAVVEISEPGGAWNYNNPVPAYYMQMAARQAVWHYWLAREGDVSILYEDRTIGAFGPYPANVYLHRATEIGLDILPLPAPYAYLATDAYADTFQRLKDRYPTATVELWVTADNSDAGLASVLPMASYQVPRAGMALDGPALGTYHFPNLPVPQRNRASTDTVLFLYEGEVVVTG